MTDLAVGIDGPRLGRQPRPVATHPVHARHAARRHALLHAGSRLGERPGVGDADQLEPVTSRQLSEARAHQPSRLRTTKGGGSPVGAMLTGVSGMATRGIRNPKVDPRPASAFAAAQIRPPWASMMARLI